MDKEPLFKTITIVDEFGNELPDDPLTRAIKESYQTGKEVIWNDSPKDYPPGDPDL